MFERYEKIFMTGHDGEEGDSHRIGTGAGSRTAAPDMPFDRALRKHILGEGSASADQAPQPRPGATDALPSAPAQSGDVLDLSGTWHAIRPAWRRQQTAAQRLRTRNPEVRRAADLLRTRLLQKLHTEGWRRVAVTAPEAGCGTTFTALNLALSISAVADFRTVLLDLNLRQPGLGRILDGNGIQEMSDLLRGRVPVTEYLLRYAENLAVGLNSEVSPNPAELLQSRSAGEALDEIERQLAPDVVLCDMPPLLAHDDTLGFLPQVDCVLLVADGTRTLSTQIAECEDLLEGKAPLAGVVLDRGRAPR